MDSQEVRWLAVVRPAIRRALGRVVPRPGGARRARGAPGFALAAALLILFLMTIVATASVTLGTGMLGLSHAATNQEECWQAALAGLAEAKKIVAQTADLTRLADVLPATENSFDARSPKLTYYTLSVKSATNATTCTVRSVGYIKGTTARCSVLATYSKQSVFWAGMFGTSAATARGTVLMDSWSSNQGNYEQTQSRDPNDATVATNSTAPGAITLQGTVDAFVNLLVGPGGDPAVGITASDGLVKGSRGTLLSPMILTPATAPSGPVLPAVTGAPPGGTLAPGNYEALSLNGHESVKLVSGTYYFPNGVSLTGQSTLTVDSSSGPVVLIFGGQFDQQGGSVSNGSGVPGNFVVLGTSDATSARFTGNTSLYMACMAPQAEITVSGGCEVYGAVIGQSISFTGTAGMHYDKALANLNIPGQPQINSARTLLLERE